MSQDNINFCDICFNESCTEYITVCDNKHKCCSNCYTGLKKLGKCHQCRQTLLKNPNDPPEPNDPPQTNDQPQTNNQPEPQTIIFITRVPNHWDDRNRVNQLFNQNRVNHWNDQNINNMLFMFRQNLIDRGLTDTDN